MFRSMTFVAVLGTIFLMIGRFQLDSVEGANFVAGTQTSLGTRSIGGYTAITTPQRDPNVDGLQEYTVIIKNTSGRSAQDVNLRVKLKAPDGTKTGPTLDPLLRYRTAAHAPSGTPAGPWIDRANQTVSTINESVTTPGTPPTTTVTPQGGSLTFDLDSGASIPAEGIEVEFGITAAGTSKKDWIVGIELSRKKSGKSYSICAPGFFKGSIVNHVAQTYASEHHKDYLCYVNNADAAKSVTEYTGKIKAVDHGSIVSVTLLDAVTLISVSGASVSVTGNSFTIDNFSQSLTDEYVIHVEFAEKPSEVKLDVTADLN